MHFKINLAINSNRYDFSNLS